MSVWTDRESVLRCAATHLDTGCVGANAVRAVVLVAGDGEGWRKRNGRDEKKLRGGAELRYVLRSRLARGPR